MEQRRCIQVSGKWVKGIIGKWKMGKRGGGMKGSWVAKWETVFKVELTKGKKKRKEKNRIE